MCVHLIENHYTIIIIIIIIIIMGQIFNEHRKKIYRLNFSNRCNIRVFQSKNLLDEFSFENENKKNYNLNFAIPLVIRKTFDQKIALRINVH